MSGNNAPARDSELRLQRLEEEAGFTGRSVESLSAEIAELNRRMAELERTVFGLAARLEAGEGEGAADEQPAG